MRRTVRLVATVLVVAVTATVAALAGPVPEAAATNTNSVTFSVERGYFTNTFTLTLTGPGTILYSTAWGDEWLAADFTPIAQTYSAPITISGSTQVRAMVVGDEHAESHTYINISSWSAADQAIITSYPAMVTTADLIGDRFNDERTIVEFWHPNGSSAHAPAGIRNRQNGLGQNGDFRLYFRDEYGDGRLNHQLFPNENAGAQTSGGHDKVNFHGGSQDAFDINYGTIWGCTLGQGTHMRDRFFQRTQRHVNGDGVPGEYYLMWWQDTFVGVKNAEDVPQQGFMEEYFGDNKDNYGLWTWYSQELPPGNPYSSGNLTSFMNSVDLVNYADYLLVQWFSGNIDWGSVNQNNNVVVGGLFDGPYYHWQWDSHLTEPGCSTNWGHVPLYTANPLSDPDFLTLLRDRANLHFTGSGALTSAQVLATWDALQAELAPAVPLVYSGNWTGAEQVFRGKVATASAPLYSWMQSQGYASSIAEVSYSLPAGPVASGSTVALSGGGEIWYTLDGTDPRAPGGGINPDAMLYFGPIALPDGTVQMHARVKQGAAWGPARPVIYQVDAPSLVITEAIGEYVEITNTGTTPIDLEYWRLQGDVRFKFDFGASPILLPGQIAVIAEDAAVFEARWGFAPDGEFLDNLNGTTNLQLVDTDLIAQHDVASPLYDDGLPAGAAPPVPAAADPPGLILNEWNAVSSTNMTTDPDPLLGIVAGNGGDWFEVVTVNDVDLRGWKLTATDIDSIGTIELSQNAVWSNVPAGTIITFSQDPVVAEDGTVYGTDVSFDPANDDWWIHIVTNEANTYVTQTVFPASADDWRLTIANAADQVQWGPTGEGVGSLLTGVGTAEIGELEAHPSPDLDPVTAPYDDGNSSTFGAPNAFGGGEQNFYFLRNDFEPGENTNCDGSLTIVDALFVAQYTVGNRTDFPGCPLGDPTTQLNVQAGDINVDGITDIVDSLLISQCTVGIDNGWCPPDPG